MWGLFAIAAIAAIIFLLLPGYLLLRAIKMQGWMALGCAPFASVACYSILCVVYGSFGVSCTWVSVFVPVLLVAIVAFGASWLLASTNPSGWSASCAQVVAVYLIAGIAVTCGVYLVQIGAPDAFIQSWDNVHHLDAVRAFADSGRWSSLGTTLYLGEDAAVDPFVEGSFYPSAWHAFAAMVVSLLGVSAPFAINVANFTIMAIAFPLGVHAFMRVLFDGDEHIVAAGCVVMLANASCFLTMLTWGPLYPNVMANCLLPGAMCAFVVLLSDKAGKGERIASCVVLAVAVVSYVFIQPNGVFSAVLLLAPYFVVRVFDLVRNSRRLAQHGGAIAKVAPVGTAVLAVVVIVVFWFVAYSMPFMQAVVQYNWPIDSTVSDALMDIVTQRYHVPGLAIGCALLLAAGVVSTLVRRRHRWLIASWLLASATYVACVSVDGPWHQILAGFWYTDVPRVASLAALSAVPLQAIGLAEVVTLAVCPFERQRAKRAAGAVLIVIVAALLFVPTAGTETVETETRVFSNASALGVEGGHVAYEYRSYDPLIYDGDERAFVQEALSLIPEGSLVINEPNDGSAYAYGVDGLRTYYRYWRGYGDPAEGEKPESALIRGRLCNIDSDDGVKAAVETVGAQYVLQLDRGERSWETTMWLYGDGMLWRGIDGIDEDTPGFELVLARDDMKLYKIVA